MSGQLDPASGQLDPTFGTNGNVALSSVIGPTIGSEPDGKILLAGQYAVKTGFSSTDGIARYGTDGSSDTSFGTNGSVSSGYIPSSPLPNPLPNTTNPSFALAQTNGDILLVSSGFYLNSSNSWSSDIVMQHYYADGTLDTSFGSDGTLNINLGSFVSMQVLDARLDSQSRVVAAGSAFDGATNYGFVARFSQAGTLDTGFHGQGYAIFNPFSAGTNAVFYHTALLSDDSVIAVGNDYTNYGDHFTGGPVVVKYSPNGQPDASFGVNGVASVNDQGTFYGAVADSAGDIYTNEISYTNSTQTNVYKFSPNGALDTDFGDSGVLTLSNMASGALDAVDSSSGLIMGVGVVDPNSGLPTTAAVVRILPSGVLDGSFGAAGVATVVGPSHVAVASAVAVDGLGRILVSSTAFDTDGNATSYLSRVVDEAGVTAPSDLTATSPTQNPTLSWDSVANATSYNIYRNGVLVASTPNNAYVDTSAPEGASTYYVTAVRNTTESSPSNTVAVLIDRTAPTITASITPAPNSNGWVRTSPVTVTFTCLDNAGGSGIASCPSPQTESADGNYTISGIAVDNAGNSATVTVPVNVDTTVPTVVSAVLATDPLPVNQTTTLSASVADSLSGVTYVEYYVGADPGQGNATAMIVNNGTASAAVGGYSTPGMYTFFVRDEDTAGNWSAPTSVTLDVYNPAGGYTAGHGQIVPNSDTSNTGDILPSETGNNVQARFDFTLKYLSSTSTMPTGSATFTWGSECNSPHSNCFTVMTDTTVSPTVGGLSWLLVPQDGTATFQGTASLNQGATNLGANYPFRVYVSSTTPTAPGQYEIQIFPIGSDPGTTAPLYQASGDLVGGAVVMH